MPQHCTECTQYCPQSELLSFDVRERLGGTHPFVASETAEISQLVEAAEADVRGYNSKINWLRQRAATLEVEKRAFEERLLVAKSLLSPIRRLPVEVLLHIFAFCSDDNEITCTNTRHVGGNLEEIEATLRIVMYPLRLMKVCRSWKLIVASNPSLWSILSVNILITPTDVTMGEAMEHAVASVLRASRNHPLEIALWQIPGFGGSLHASIMLCVAECRRWSWASLTFPDLQALCDGQLQSLQGNVPLLEHVELYSEARVEETHILAIAPRLRSVKVEYSPTSKIALPWSQLHYVECARGLFAEAVQCLQWAKRLRYFSVEGFCSWDTADDSSLLLTPIVSNVDEVHLQLERYHKQENEQILSMMRCPQIRSLTLGCIDESEEDGPEEEEPEENSDPVNEIVSGPCLCAFLSSCSKTLTMLTLGSNLLSEEDFINALGLIPQLEVLNIRNVQPRPFFTAATCSRLLGYGQGISRTLIPKLQYLTVHLAHGNGVDFSQFSTLVLSRCIPTHTHNAIACSTLKNVSFSIGDISFSLEEQAKWKPCLVEGLSVTLMDRDGFVNIHDSE